jgi:hypothetical protein
MFASQDIQVLGVLFALGLGACAPAEEIQEGAPEAPVARSQTGDTLWVILNHVKPDKREQVEEFLFQVLLPATEQVAETDPTKRAILDQTRMLLPLRANPDSTYTYVWVMDPLVVGANYSYRPILGEVYTEEEVERYMEMWNDALAGPQVSFRVTQSLW